MKSVKMVKFHWSVDWSVGWLVGSLVVLVFGSACRSLIAVASCKFEGKVLYSECRIKLNEEQKKSKTREN